MEINPKQKLLEKANLISKVFFLYMNKVLKIGHKKPFKTEDLFRLDQEMTYENHFNNFEIHLNKMMKKKKSFVRALFSWYVPIAWASFVGHLFFNLLNLANPYLLELFINWLKRPY